MSDVDIYPVGPGELPLVVNLFNEVFRPSREQAYFERRFLGRHNPLILIAQLDHHPVGFALGYEAKPGTFYCWLLGVQAELRRRGIASQLMEGVSAWARDHDYHTIRFECFNRQRAMLHLAIRQGYHVVGIRHDNDTGQDLVILELSLDEEERREEHY